MSSQYRHLATSSFASPIQKGPRVQTSTTNMNIVAPWLTNEIVNEAEILGYITWLWTYSEMHRELPVQVLPALVLAAIKHGQYVLALENKKPVFFMSWAAMDEEAESRYIEHLPEYMRLEDWNSGDRIWFLDWLAPFGHTRQMQRLLSRELFNGQCARALYHRGQDKGLRVQTYRGHGVTSAQAREWFRNHPIKTGLL